jgi:hypothetical protein
MLDQVVGDVRTLQILDRAQPVDTHAQQRQRLAVALGLRKGEWKNGIQKGCIPHYGCRGIGGGALLSFGCSDESPTVLVRLV